MDASTLIPGPLSFASSHQLSVRYRIQDGGYWSRVRYLIFLHFSRWVCPLFSLTSILKYAFLPYVWFFRAFFLIRRPKTHRGKRAIEQRAPKDLENTKTALFIRGGRTSETVTQAMKDLVSCRKGGVK